MDPSREPPWAEHEKVYLLAEILKAHPIPSQLLFGVVRDYNIQPRWSDMPLPPGRSLRSSQTAYDQMAGVLSSAVYRRPPQPTPVMYSGPEASKKRPLQPEISTPTGRLLQPRPPHPYSGDYVHSAGPAYASALTPTSDSANRKKRGRPTKAEAHQRAQEAAARGEVYPPPRRGRVPVAGSHDPAQQALEARSLEQTPPQTAHTVHGASMTPQHEIQAEPGSESSSGKKRRTKPQPLELEKSARAQSEMESPSVTSSSGHTRNLAYSTFTPVSAQLPTTLESRDRDTRMEGVEDTQPRTTTPHSFKDTVGI